MRNMETYVHFSKQKKKNTVTTELVVHTIDMAGIVEVKLLLRLNEDTPSGALWSVEILMC